MGKEKKIKARDKADRLVKEAVDTTTCDRCGKQYFYDPMSCLDHLGNFCVVCTKHLLHNK